MCVIAYKPSGAKPLLKRDLKEMWDRNGDGAGFAYMAVKDDDKVFWAVEKGFMKWKKFWKAFREHDFKSDNEYICHFRIKTHGLVDGGNTHPFPVTDDYDKMREEKFNTDVLVFHNGTCGAGDGVASDTMVFIKNVFDALIPYIKDEKVDKVLTMILKDTHDKWLFCNGEKVWMYGDFKEKDKCYYSNMLWEPAKVYSTPYTGSGYNHGNAFTGNSVTSEKEREGVVDSDGNVIWEDEKELNDGIVMCPNCMEDKYLDESPFEGVGDTVCFKCGAVFNDLDGKIWMYDEDIKSGKQHGTNTGV